MRPRRPHPPRPGPPMQHSGCHSLRPPHPHKTVTHYTGCLPQVNCSSYLLFWPILTPPAPQCTASVRQRRSLACPAPAGLPIMLRPILSAAPAALALLAPGSSPQPKPRPRRDGCSAMGLQQGGNPGPAPFLGEVAVTDVQCGAPVFPSAPVHPHPPPRPLPGFGAAPPSPPRPGR